MLIPVVETSLDVSPFGLNMTKVLVLNMMRGLVLNVTKCRSTFFKTKIAAVHAALKFHWMFRPYGLNMTKWLGLDMTVSRTGTIRRRWCRK